MTSTTAGSFLAHDTLNSAASSCDLVPKAVSRYFKRIFPGEHGRRGSKRSSKQFPHGQRDILNLGFLDLVKLELEGGFQGCEKMPHGKMNETYSLLLHPKDVSQRYIRSTTVWGLLRGLETFSQLAFVKDGAYTIKTTHIVDYPRFPFRGFMLDTSRHYYSMRSLLDNLDLMEMNKLNVFHWHAVDNQAFSYQSKKFPNLSSKGAYDPVTHVYTQEDVRELIEAARIRGIRVIPEFDTPGHTQSWEKGQPGVLTQCYDAWGEHPLLGIYGPMDPTKASVFEFLAELYDEISEVFPDKMIHIGGDEVNLKCWKTNPRVLEVMDLWNITGDFKKLESHFIESVLNIVDNLRGDKQSIVWEEVFANGDQIKDNTVVQVWKNWGTGWKNELRQITSAGYYALLSAPWYLNYNKYGSDWAEMYEADPHDFVGNQDQIGLVLGGSTCMWSEFTNSINLIPKSWPRASAVAERLWSGPEVKDLDAAAARLQEHECRLLARGYPVQPVVGAGFCPVHWN